MLVLFPAFDCNSFRSNAFSPCCLFMSEPLYNFRTLVQFPNPQTRRAKEPSPPRLVGLHERSMIAQKPSKCVLVYSGCLRHCLAKKAFPSSTSNSRSCCLPPSDTTLDAHACVVAGYRRPPSSAMPPRSPRPRIIPTRDRPPFTAPSAMSHDPFPLFLYDDVTHAVSVCHNACYHPLGPFDSCSTKAHGEYYRDCQKKEEEKEKKTTSLRL